MKMTEEDRDTLMRLLEEGYGVTLGIYRGNWDVKMYRNPSVSRFGDNEFRCHQCGFSGSLKSILDGFEQGFITREIKPG